MNEDFCDGCGGGIDRDHPTTCSACLYERATGRRYERDVDLHRRNGSLSLIARLRAAISTPNVSSRPPEAP